MDPLSHVLALSNVESAVCAELRAGGDWAIEFDGQLHVKFGVVLVGSCWLSVDGVPGPVRLQEGDFYLIVGGRPYRIASDPALPPVRAETVWAPDVEVGHCGLGHDTTLLGGRLGFDRANAELLLDALPPLLHLAAGSDETRVLSATLHLITHEARTSLPGRTVMLDHLAHIILLQGLRAHAAAGADGVMRANGWLASVRDHRIAAALTVMHDDVARNWQVAELAKAAGMSRSAFFARFKEVVGVSPVKYLQSLRMHSAKHILVKSNSTVSSVASKLGYGSEGAFSTAFKRVMGASPRDYRTLAATSKDLPGS